MLELALAAMVGIAWFILNRYLLPHLGIQT